MIAQMEHRAESREALKHSRLLEMLWQSQQPAIDIILNDGLEAYIPLHSSMFSKNAPMNIACIDGRVNRRRIAIAGSGVLWSDEERAEVINYIKNSGVIIKSVLRHHNCGAEGLLKKQLIQNGMTEAEAEQEVVRRITALAHGLGVEVSQGQAGMVHIHSHPERSLLVIGTDVFDVTRLPALYPFQLNARFCPSPKVIIDRVKLAMQIASGDHGFGPGRFTKQTPFVVCILGSPFKEGFSAEGLTRLIKEPLAREFGESVQIRGFDVPKKYL